MLPKLTSLIPEALGAVGRGSGGAQGHFLSVRAFCPVALDALPDVLMQPWFVSMETGSSASLQD